MSPCLIVLISWDSAFPLMPRAQICSSSTAESRNKLCDLLFGSAKGTSSLRPSHIRSNSSRWNWALRDTCRIPARRSARSVSFLSDSFNLQNPRDCHTQRANGYLEVFLDLPYLHTAGHSRCTVCVGKDAMTASSGMECKKSNTTVFTARNKTILACASKRALFKKIESQECWVVPHVSLTRMPKNTSRRRQDH